MVFNGIKDYPFQWNTSLLSGGDRMEGAKTGRERSSNTLKLTKQYCPKRKPICYIMILQTAILVSPKELSYSCNSEKLKVHLEIIMLKFHK